MPRKKAGTTRCVAPEETESAAEPTADATEPEPVEPDIVDEVIASMREGREGRVMTLGDNGLSIHLPGVVPTGSEWIDLAIGRGGWPLGRVSMVSGDEGAGKSSLALHACANAQKAGGVAFYMDAEYKLDRAYAAALGVNVDKLIVAQPDSMEDAFDLITELAITFGGHRASDRVPLFGVFDSLNAFVTQQELEGKDTPGSSARAMSKGLKRLVPLISRHRMALLMISQVREKIGVVYGSKKQTACGNAPRFYSSVIVTIDPMQGVKEGDRKVGALVKVEIGKNQIAPPFQQCKMVVRYGQGVDYIDSLHNALVACGLAAKKEKEGEARRRFARREEPDDDGDIDEKKPKKGGSGWVEFDAGGKLGVIRWQGPGGLRDIVSDRPAIRDLLVGRLRDRYGWDHPPVVEP